MSGAGARERAHLKLLPGGSRAGDSVCGGVGRESSRSRLSSPSTLIPTDMARKGRKTRWRKLPIPLAHANQGKTTPTSRSRVPVIGGSPSMEEEVETEEPAAVAPKQQSRVTFNEDEYTKITTPRQDIMFKKGYLGKKKATSETTHYDLPPTSPSESAESCEVQYVEDGLLPQPYLYPSGYIDHNGLFYLNSGSYEVYEPYTGNLTVIVPGGYAGGMPGPMYPVPIPPVEWYPAVYPPQPPPPPTTHKKRNSTDSQNWGSSCESPSSPQEAEPAEPVYFGQPFPVYPAAPFVFPPPQQPVFPVNGMVPTTGSTLPTSGAMAPPTPTTPPAPQPTPDTAPKRRKKRRKKRRPGMGEEGSESSCEEVGGGGSSDGGQGSSCSKTTDSGVHTAASGADSPQPQPPSDDASDDHWQSARGVASPNSGSATPISNRPASPLELAKCQIEECQKPENNSASIAIDSLESNLPPTSQDQTIIDTASATTRFSDEDKAQLLDCVASDQPLITDHDISIPAETLITVSISVDKLNVVSNENLTEMSVPDDTKTPQAETTNEEVNSLRDSYEEDTNQYSCAQTSNGISTVSLEERLIKVQNNDLTSICEVPDMHCVGNKEIPVTPLDNEKIIPIIEERPVSPLDKEEKVQVNDLERIDTSQEIFRFHQETIKSNLDLTLDEKEVCTESPTVNGRISDEDTSDVEYKKSDVNVSLNFSSLNLDESSETRLVDSKVDKVEIKELECIEVNDIDRIPTKQLSLSDDIQTSQLPDIKTHEISENSVSVFPCEQPISRIEDIKQEVHLTKDVCTRDRIDSDEGFEAGSEVKWSNAEENCWASNESESPKSQPLSIETEEVWGLAEEWGVEALPEGSTSESKPLTEVVTKWLETNWPPPPQHSVLEFEGTENNTHSSTGSKNAVGNPFPARYPSVGTRVANFDEVEEYQGWVAERCKPADWVSRYYRLARSPSPPVHGPFPCGLVCCILQ